jgi:uncharacterized repeat protein (TIGR03803 family)
MITAGEEKNRRTYFLKRRSEQLLPKKSRSVRRAGDKSFLVLFFKKELLTSFRSEPIWVAIAVALTPAAQAATLKTLTSIKGSIDGQTPYAAPIKVGGALYGTTANGGKYFSGEVYRQDLASGKTTTIYSFTGGTDGGGPYAVTYAGGQLYGTAITGGVGGNGSIFKIDPATGQETTLYDFAGGTDGSNPQSGLTNVDGVLFGTTPVGGAYSAGTVFSFNLSTGTETIVHSFGANGNDGANPHSSLTRSGRLLYGTTYYGGANGGWGTVYAIDPKTGAETVVHAFDRSDGYFPNGAVVASGKTLYGTTGFYGPDLPGEVFAVDRDTGAETTLYRFSGGSDGGSPYAGPTLQDGILYGTTSSGGGGANNGTIYAIDLATGSGKTVYRFSSALGTPLLAGLIAVDGVLYGATVDGGLAGGGALYSFETGNSAVALTHSFTGNSPGGYANPGLTAVGASLYAVEPRGGTSNLGGVLRIDPATGAVKTLESFAGGRQGYGPSAPLLSLHGSFYGTTAGGDPSRGINGTVFKFSRAGGPITTLHGFSGDANGAGPNGELLDVDATLWGTTEFSSGTIFKVDPVTGRTVTVHEFGGTNDGWSPQGPLVEAGGLLYGTTLFDCCGDGPGTIFQIDPKSGTESVAYNFDYGKQFYGFYPSGGLVKVGHVMYGALIYGPNYNGGVIFAFDPKTNSVTQVYSFTGGSDGAAPYAPPIELNGALYGTASQGGASGNGTVYALNPKTGAETTLYSFTGSADGGSPQARLINVGGTLYGTTSLGGSDNRGTVFSLAP